MARGLLSLLVAVAAVLLAASAVAANHTCALRVGTEGPPDSGSTTPITVAAGDTVYIYLYDFTAGVPARLEWSVDGEHIEAKDQVVAVSEGAPNFVRVTLAADDIGEVGIQPTQAGAFLSGACGVENSNPGHELRPFIIHVTAGPVPATDLEDMAASPTTAAPMWLVLLVAVPVALLVAIRPPLGTHQRHRRF
jgi:hypothetical protein